MIKLDLLLVFVLVFAFSCSKDKTTPDNTVTDIDGNVYKTVVIGEQTWMAENLIVLHFRNGDVISTTTLIDDDICSEDAPILQWPAGGDEANVPVYGRLYTWHAAIDSRDICPKDWHVPTIEEWQTLIEYLGENEAGNKMKEIGISHWPYSSDEVTNSSGFTGRGSGYRGCTGGFGDNLPTYAANYWASTQYNSMWAKSFSLWDSESKLFENFGVQENAMSIRCIKD